MAAHKLSSIPQGGKEHPVHQSNRPRHKQSRHRSSDQATRMTADQRQQQPVQQEEDHQQPPQSPDDQQLVQQNLDENSDGSGTDPEEFDEVVNVVRAALHIKDYNERLFFAQMFEARKDVECAICLGIMKKTRTVMGCLHRFCRECIDKSMRLVSNECPACRVHCSSRRSLRDDLDYDALIEAIYPDLTEFELEELIFHEEEKARNQQVQATIAEISRRQSEALNKRRRTYRDADDLRVSRCGLNANSRRNNQRTHTEPDSINETENDLHGNLNPSKSDRSRLEIKNCRPKRRAHIQPPPAYPSACNPDNEYFENPMQPMRGKLVSPLGAPHDPEMLTWGRGGARSHARHGGGSGGRATMGSQISKLMEHLGSSSNIDHKSEIPFALVSLDEERIPNLEKPWLCLQSSFSVNQVCKLVADQMKVQAKDVKMLLVKEENTNGKTSADYSQLIDGMNPLSLLVNWSNIGLEILEGQETLGALSCFSNTGYLILAYQYRKDDQEIQLSPR